MAGSSNLIKLARAVNTPLRQSRRSLSVDELLAGKNHRMHFEQRFPKEAAFFYSIDLILNHEWVRGALLEGSCALIFAESQREADELAQEGLSSTLESAFAYHFGMDGQPVVRPDLEFGGRRGDPTPVNPETLRTDVATKDALVSRLDRKAKKD